MSCEPKFVKEIDWDCVKELISHVREGKVSVCCVEKGLWVAGCALSMFAKDEESPVPFGSSVEADRSVEDLCDAIEAAIPAEGVIQGPAQLDPATILMIVQLVWKLVQAFRK